MESNATIAVAAPLLDEVLTLVREAELEVSVAARTAADGADGIR